VAVHPDDERYGDLIGQTLFTPIFEREVPVVADESVEMDFGTGVVMICTIGDKEDLRWVFKYDLDLEKGIDEHGRMTDLAGEYRGLKIREARDKIINDMRERGLLVAQEDNPQNIGTCWRCHTTIEYLQVPQWFVRILDMKDDVLAAADRINWYPDFMKVRLREWVNSLTWDWVISRQRYFATPIPVWECEDCGKPVVAREEDCYVDPTIDHPPIDECPSCGGPLKGSEEVFDTWMDSSITSLYNTFWERDPAMFTRLYPMSLRPQSHDIIRTWAFYSIVRGLKLENEIPWENIMMGGFILAPDGTPMHASKGNAVDPLEFHAQFGADPIRYYAATCTLGKDHPFRVKDVKRGGQIIRKLFNMERLMAGFYSGLETEEFDEIRSRFAKNPEGLRPVDRWILHRFSRVVEEATESCDVYQFDKSVKSTVDFLWLEVADQYLEMVKYRRGARDDAAAYTLFTLALGIAKLLAPFLPHIVEEVYQTHLRPFEGEKSIHISGWPEPVLEDPLAFEKGELTAGIVRAVRRYKSDMGISLGAEMGPIRLITDERDKLLDSLEDIKGTLRTSEVTLESSGDLELRVTGVKPVFKNMGPLLKDRVGAVVATLKDPEISRNVAAEIESGGSATLTPSDDRGEVVLTGDLVEIEKKWSFKGREVNHLTIEGIAVVLENME
jgi:valyl-tRNA synthetase